MIHKEIEKALSAQINQEFTAAYHYLGMAAYFDSMSLDGFAHWMLMQHDEENQHAMRLFRYLLDRGGTIDLNSINQPQVEFDSPLDVFEQALKQEQENTASINKLYELSTSLNDHATTSHLQWFIDEQVEEEKSMEDIIARLKLAKEDSSALLYLNDKLGERVQDTSAEQEG